MKRTPNATPLALWRAALLMAILAPRVSRACPDPPELTLDWVGAASCTVERGDDAVFHLNLTSTDPLGRTLWYWVEASDWAEVSKPNELLSRSHVRVASGKLAATETAEVEITISTADFVEGGVYQATFEVTAAPPNVVIVGDASRQFTISIVGHDLAILRDGVKASGMTFHIPFSQGKNDAWYRDRLHLRAGEVVDYDTVEAWNTTTSQWESQYVEDSTHPNPQWSFNPSGVQTVGAMTISCTWTDDNDPPGTQDDPQPDSVTVIIDDMAESTGYAAPIVEWFDSGGTPCAAIDTQGNLILRGTLHTGLPLEGSSSDPAWRVRNSSANEVARLRLQPFLDKHLSIVGAVSQTFKSFGAPSSYPFSLNNSSQMVAAIDSSGNLYLRGFKIEGGYGPALVDDQPYGGPPGHGATSDISAAAFMTYAAQKQIGRLPALESDLTDADLNSYLDPTAYKDTWIGSNPAGNPIDESELLAKLAFACYLLHLDPVADQAKLEHMFQLLYDQVWQVYIHRIDNNTYDHKPWGNKGIRNLAAEVIAGMTLCGAPNVTFGPPEAPLVSGTVGNELIAAALPSLRNAFEHTFNWDTRRCYLDAEERDPLVAGYKEGWEYGMDLSDPLMASVAFFFQHLALPPDAADPAQQAADRDFIVSRYRQFVRYIAETQTPWGRWLSQNDSRAVWNWTTVRALYTIFSDDAALRNLLRSVYARMSDPVSADPNIAHKGLLFYDPWLDAALFGMPEYQGDPDPYLWTVERVYPKAGQLFLGGPPYNPDTPLQSTDAGVFGAFFNEAGWDSVHSASSHSHAYHVAASTETTGYVDLVYERWDAVRKSFLSSDQVTTRDPEDYPATPIAPEHWDDYTDEFWMAHLDAAPSLSYDIDPRETHKRRTDTHFEIFAYGKGLLIGPGRMLYLQHSPWPETPASGHDDVYRYSQHAESYPTDLSTSDAYAYNPYIDWTDPRAYNMMRVGASPNDARFPRTVEFELGSPGADRDMIDKVLDLGGEDNPPAHLYKMPSNRYSRYVLWGRRRYFIVCDLATDSSPQYLEERFHGRGKLLCDLSVPATPVFLWKWGERYGDQHPQCQHEPEYNARDYAVRDERIRLLVYPGNPIQSGGTACTDWSIDWKKSDTIKNGDSGDRDFFEPFLESHNYYAHDVLTLKTHYVDETNNRNQHGMVTLFWPQNTALTNGVDERPALVWTYHPTTGNVLDEIDVTVTYTQEGFNFTDNWKFPLTAGIEDYDDVKD
ncbi:MAG: hypothetical protein NTW86_29915 [Candidatus Sumerlaeota bacterium]|nr:hypothetical protein [Candidatus Sumerlaeota bacterium]